MAYNGAGSLYAHNEDDIDEDLWKSPSKKDSSSNASKGEQSGSSATGPQAHTGKTKYDDGESKEATLRNELQSVRKVNEAIEGVIDSLNKAQSSMKVSLPVLCPLRCTKNLCCSRSTKRSTQLPFSSIRGRGFCLRPNTTNG